MVADKEIDLNGLALDHHLLHEHFTSSNITEQINLGSLLEKITQEEDVLRVLIFGYLENPPQNVKAIGKSFHLTFVVVDMTVGE
jgi:hypothetical protein